MPERLTREADAAPDGVHGDLGLPRDVGDVVLEHHAEQEGLGLLFGKREEELAQHAPQASIDRIGCLVGSLALELDVLARADFLANFAARLSVRRTASAVLETMRIANDWNPPSPRKAPSCLTTVSVPIGTASSSSG